MCVEKSVCWTRRGSRRAFVSKAASRTCKSQPDADLGYSSRVVQGKECSLSRFSQQPYSIPQKQQQVCTISFWLSPSPVWACSIYLFRQHFISFWRSHFTL